MKDLHTAQDYYEYFAAIPENLRTKTPVYVDAIEDGEEQDSAVCVSGELYVSGETAGGLDGGITITHDNSQR